MARNTKNGTRIGRIKDRIQWYNPKTKKYVKYDKKRKRILSCSNNPYKGIPVINKEKIKMK